MDPAVPEPEALGGPTGTPPRVGSNPSNIKYKQPIPNHFSGGKESTFRFSAGVHKQRPCMPVATRTTEGKITYVVPSPVVSRWENKKNGTFCAHYFVEARNAPE
jgi:hypothetical protein